jgi:hypothetical protein
MSRPLIHGSRASRTTWLTRSSLIAFVVLATLMPGCKKEKEIPGVPSLQLPVNEATSVSHFPTYTWNEVKDADNYEVEVSNSASDFGPTQIMDQATTSSISYKNADLYYGNGFYYWRVRASNSKGDGNWSEIRMFRVDSNSPDQPGPDFGQVLVYDPSLPSGVTYSVSLYGFGSAGISCAGGWPSDCDAPDTCSFARFNGIYDGYYNCTVNYSSGPNSGQTAFTGHVSGSLGQCVRVNVHDLN